MSKILEEVKNEWITCIGKEEYDFKIANAKWSIGLTLIENFEQWISEAKTQEHIDNMKKAYDEYVSKIKQPEIDAIFEYALMDMELPKNEVRIKREKI